MQIMKRRPVIYSNVNLINKYGICILDQNKPVHQTCIIFTSLNKMSPVVTNLLFISIYLLDLMCAFAGYL